MSRSNLIPISHFNPTEKVRLSACADTVIYGQEGDRCLLRAIRFGGHPEMLNAVSDAIYAGAKIDVTLPSRTLRLEGESKRFDRQVNHDGVYAEATLPARDDEREAEDSTDAGDHQPPSDDGTENRTAREMPDFLPQGRQGALV